MQFRPIHMLIVVVLLLLGGCGAQEAMQSVPPPTSTAPAAADTASVSAAATTVTTAPAAQAPTSEPTAPPATPTLGPNMFLNPVIRQDFPDPDVLKVGDTYYAYATGNFEKKISVQTARSTDLINWETLPGAMPAFPAWAEPDHGLVWAPEVTTATDGQTYLLYFTARVAKTNTQCIGVATSASPEGPFESPAPEPFICQRDQGGSIDASSFADEDGTRYLLWKNDGNCCGSETYIYIQPISADGLTLEGEPTQLIKSDQGWEGLLVEAPTMWKQNGTYYLFYSANDYSTPRYAIGYATADAVLGPFTKSAEPLVVSDLKNAVVGPGGQDIVVDPDGDTWMVYHAWGPGYRTMNANALLWEDDAPALNGPSGKLPKEIPSAQ